MLPLNAVPSIRVHVLKQALIHRLGVADTTASLADLKKRFAAYEPHDLETVYTETIALLDDALRVAKAGIPDAPSLRIVDEIEELICDRYEIAGNVREIAQTINMLAEYDYTKRQP